MEASENFENQKRFLFRPRPIHICHKSELKSRWTIPLNTYTSALAFQSSVAALFTSFGHGFFCFADRRYGEKQLVLSEKVASPGEILYASSQHTWLSTVKHCLPLGPPGSLQYLMEHRPGVTVSYIQIPPLHWLECVVCSGSPHRHSVQDVLYTVYWNFYSKQL